MLTGTDQQALLGAMKAVVAHPSAPESLGRRFVEATSALLLGTPLEGGYPGLDPTSAQQLARALSGKPSAGLAAELIATSSVVDGVNDPDRISAALSYARALDVHAGWVEVLTAVAAGRLDEAMAMMVVINTATFPGLAPPGEAPNLLPYDGTSDADRRLHAKYEALEGYPRDSFGRALWVHFRRHGFRWPGQEGGFAEAFAIRHDSLHVLAEYETSIQGEILVSTFTGRMHRTDALAAHLLPVIFQWHIGQEVNGIGAQHGGLDPWKFVAAWRRGTDTQYDVLRPDWDFFEAAQRPLAELRQSYGIPPLPPQFRASGPEVNVTAEADPTVT